MKTLAAVFTLLMAPVYGAITRSPGITSTGGTAISSFSWSHTVTSGANRLLVVSVSHYYTFPTPGTITSITFGGVPLTQKIKASVSGDADTHEIWTLTNPAVSTDNIVVTFAAAVEGAIAGSVVFTGSTGPLSVANMNSANNVSGLSITTSSTADYAYVSWMDWNDSAIADGTAAFNVTGGGGIFSRAGVQTGITPTNTINFNNPAVIMAGFAVQESAGVPGTRKRTVVTN